jgi:hypothetical protein
MLSRTSPKLVDVSIVSIMYGRGGGGVMERAS